MKEKTENNKNRVLVPLIIIITVVMFLVSASFAYFTTRVVGNDDASTVNVQTGYLAIDFDTSEYISNRAGELIQDNQREQLADYTSFTVKHKANSTHRATYLLTLTDIEISDNLKSQDFKWELVKNNTVINSGNFYSIGNQSTITITPDIQTLNVSDTDSYIFRVWLSETEVDQSSLYSGTFQGRIAIEAQATDAS